MRQSITNKLQQRMEYRRKTDPYTVKCSNIKLTSQLSTDCKKISKD